MAAGLPVVTNLPATVLPPPGSTVQLGPDTDARDIAAAVSRLLEDSEWHERVSSAARDAVASWTFDDVARTVVDFVLAGSD